MRSTEVAGHERAGPGGQRDQGGEVCHERGDRHRDLSCKNTSQKLLLEN